MKFERGRDPMESLEIGVIPKIKKMLEESNRRGELRSNLMRDLVILKIEETLGVKLTDITHALDQYYQIWLKVDGFKEVIHYKFDTPY